MSRLSLLTLMPLLVVFAACRVTPLAGDRPDTARYEKCADPEGQQALDQAMVHIQAGRDDLALPLLADCVRRCPELVRAHELYQDAALHLGGAAEQQMRAWYDGAQAAPRDVVLAYAKARLLDSAYARNQALEAILARDSSFYFAQLSRARVLRSSGRLGDAIGAYQKALATNPDLLPAHLELAEVLVESGRDAEAENHFANYLRGNPNDLPAVRSYVSLLVYKLGRADQAMPFLERLLARDPEDFTALMDKAAAQWIGHHFEESRRSYLDVLERRPDCARAALNIGFLCYGVLAHDDATKLQWWPRAAAAFRMFLRLCRPEEGMDYVEQMLAVPYRIKEIETFLDQHGVALPDAGKAPTLADLK